MSFAADDEEEAAAEEQDASDAPPLPKKPKKLGKDPTVNTSFLPDRDREESERRLREELRQEWLQRQEEMKRETILITFSYWDGSGHRKEVECKKGDSVAGFLDKARGCFSELRSVSVDNLMYIVGLIYIFFFNWSLFRLMSGCRKKT